MLWILDWWQEKQMSKHRTDRASSKGTTSQRFREIQIQLHHKLISLDNILRMRRTTVLRTEFITLAPHNRSPSMSTHVAYGSSLKSIPEFPPIRNLIATQGRYTQVPTTILPQDNAQHMYVRLQQLEECPVGNNYTAGILNRSQIAGASRIWWNALGLAVILRYLQFIYENVWVYKRRKHAAIAQMPARESFRSSSMCVTAPIQCFDLENVIWSPRCDYSIDIKEDQRSSPTKHR